MSWNQNDLALLILHLNTFALEKNVFWLQIGIISKYNVIYEQFPLHSHREMLALLSQIGDKVRMISFC